MNEDKKKIALANSAKYLFLNIPDNELKKIPLKVRKKLLELMKMYSDNKVNDIEDMNDVDMAMLIALLKKYVLDAKQNEKMNELILFINKYNE